MPCQKNDPDLWFSYDPEEIQAAQNLCGGCPVRMKCLTGAIERKEGYGIWGGSVFEKGKVITDIHKLKPVTI